MCNGVAARMTEMRTVAPQTAEEQALRLDDSIALEGIIVQAI